MRQVVYNSHQSARFRRIPLDLIRDRDLIWAFVRRDALLRFRYPLVALLWTIAAPLLLTAVLVSVFTVLIDIRNVEPAAESLRLYAALVLTGVIPWLCTATVLERSTSALHRHAGPIRHAGFTREVIPMAVVVSGLVALLISGTVLFVLATIFITWPGPAYAALPGVLLIHALLLAGASLMLSLAGTHFSDMRSIVQAVIGLGFFVSPVFYTTDRVRAAFDDAPITLGWAKPIYYTNPMAGLIEAYRDIMVFRQFPSVDILIWPAISALALFGLGLVLFHRQAPTVSDVV